MRRADLPDGKLELDDPASLAAERYGRGGPLTREKINGTRTYTSDPASVLVPQGVPGWLGRPPSGLLLPPDEARCLRALGRCEVSPRPYQAAAIAKMRASRGGIVVMPPGAGKTITGLLAARALGLRVLVIVHTGDLMRQWIEAAVRIFGQPLNQIGDGRHTTGSDAGTCALVQTLTTWTPDQLEALAAVHGMLLLDESHTTGAARTWFELLWHLGTPRRYGLTATPKRADGLTDMLHWACGPTLHTVTTADLVAAGVAVLPTIHQVDTAFRFALAKQIKISRPGARWGRRLAWDGQLTAVSVQRLADTGCAVTITGVPEAAAVTIATAAKAAGYAAQATVDTASLSACYRALCEDKERIALVAARTAQRVREGRVALVLSGRVAHGQHLADALRDAYGIEAPLMSGKMAVGKRTRILDRLRAGQLRCAIAPMLADVGLDVPLLAAIVVAFPSRSDARTTQRAGRSMRPGDKLAPVVDDFVDAEIGLFVGQWMARRRAYRAAGFRFAASSREANPLRALNLPGEVVVKAVPGSIEISPRPDPTLEFGGMVSIPPRPFYRQENIKLVVAGKVIEGIALAEAEGTFSDETE
jgi:superfamily II DNA or RNA helicase